MSTKEKSLSELKRENAEKEKLFEQRAKEAEEGIEEQKIRVCRLYVERMANVFKQDILSGAMKRSALKAKIIERVCIKSKLWGEVTVRHNWPQWLLEPALKDNTWNRFGKTGEKDEKRTESVRFERRERFENREEALPEPEAAITEPEPITIPFYEEITYNDNLEEAYVSIRHLVDFYSGLKYDERSLIENNRELVAKTKAHRFDLIKKMTDTDVRTAYGLCVELDALLTDWLEQLDKELDARKKKSQIIRE